MFPARLVNSQWHLQKVYHRGQVCVEFYQNSLKPEESSVVVYNDFYSTNPFYVCYSAITREIAEDICAEHSAFDLARKHVELDLFMSKSVLVDVIEDWKTVTRHGLMAVHNFRKLLHMFSFSVGYTTYKLYPTDHDYYPIFCDGDCGCTLSVRNTTDCVSLTFFSETDLRLCSESAISTVLYTDTRLSRHIEKLTALQQEVNNAYNLCINEESTGGRTEVAG